MSNSLWPNLNNAPGLSPHQIEVASKSLSQRVGVLAGTPGCGKTYTAASIIRMVVEKFGGQSVTVAAPTGKAAVRCTETMQDQYGLQVEAKTIHRLLEIGRNGHDGKGWGFQRNNERPLDQKFVFIDEASMLDTSLAANLFDAIPHNGHVLLIGDPYQLPPVGHGAPLRDLIESGAVGYGELSEIRRNAGLIVESCRRIKSGELFAPSTQKLDTTTGRNCKHFDNRSAASQLSELQSLLEKVFQTGSDPVWDVQVLVAVNEKSPVSRMSVNQLMQRWLNPSNVPKDGQVFGRDDKVICKSNSWFTLLEDSWCPGELIKDHSTGTNEFVANGELGRVMEIGQKSMVVRLQSPSRLVSVPLKGGKGCDFDLGYAITCHKAQGSQAKIIVVLVDDSAGAGWVTSREWWYTALSRAEQVCLTIGRWDVLMKQCQKVSLRDRKTFLKERLAG